jgi:outer membrane protein OmpA-like peptidoglycan-associated protein
MATAGQDQNKDKDQDKNDLIKKKLVEEADAYFFQEDFTKALALYSEIIHDYPKSHYVQYHTFVAEHLSVKRGSDLKLLKEYEINEGHTDKFYNYWLGRIHLKRYEFEIATLHFKAFLNMNVYRTNEIKKETQGLIDFSIKAEKFYHNPNGYEIETIDSPINSKYTDISPAFFSNHDELLFMSSRPQAKDDGEFRVFHALKSGESWAEPTAVDALGSFEEKNSKIEIVNNDGRLFMYKDVKGGDLYYSEQVSDNWTQPKEFNSTLRKNIVGSHFFINDAENMILFAVQTEEDNLDIYQSAIDPVDNSWSTPHPILGDVNSEYNDDNPYLSHDGKFLYFSSDRPESIGGYDVFKVAIDESTGLWGKPINMGFPINTIDDEVNFQLNEDNISGFLSSDRLHGQGGYDIYYFHEQGKVLASGSVYNNETKELLKGARVDYHPIKYKDEAFRSYTDAVGTYRLEIFQEEDFIVEISLGNDIVFTSQITSKHEQHRKVFAKDFYVNVPNHLTEETDFTTLYDGHESIQPKFEKVENMGSKFRKGEKAIVGNIYFNLQSTELDKSSASAITRIKKVMLSNPNMVIEIAGHTCNIGTADANMTISLQRAEYVKSQLISNGIAANRLIAKGYGQTQPLASNDDDEEGRELNRRIEIRVVQ